MTPVGPEDFEPETLKAALRTMMTSRKLDEKMLILLKQGKGYFHIGASGHEAAQVGLGFHLKGGYDWFCLYYRDLTLALSVGYTAENTLQAHFAKAGDPNGAGRQMPEHFGHRELNIMSTSSSVGAQWMPGVGFGLGFAVVFDPPQTLIPCSLGEFYWGGAASTAFWVDPLEDVTAVFMTQLLPSSTYPVRRELRTLVYSALMETNG